MHENMSAGYQVAHIFFDVLIGSIGHKKARTISTTKRGGQNKRSASELPMMPNSSERTASHARVSGNRKNSKEENKIH
jgi:hypothetical protein